MHSSFRAFFFIVPPALLLAGCDELLAADDTGGAADTATIATSTDPSGGGGGGGPGGGATASGWTSSAHPCFGNRTDAMLWEGDTVWVGCGSTTEGTGLFRSVDGGRSWEAPSTNPVGFLENFRVSSIQRASDGLLYVGGIHTLGSERVVSLDTSSEPYLLREVFTTTGQLWDSFHVGTFRRAPNGLAVAESLTGTGLVYRTGDDQPWQDGYGWWTSGTGYQILDLELLGDDFYGVGSTISEPPMAFLPPRSALSGFRLEPVQLATGLAEFDGEMWGVGVDEEGIVIGGVNQDRDVGMIFIGPLGAYDAGYYASLDLSLLFPNDTTWVRGVCRNGATVVAAAEFSSRGDGIVLSSTDSGATWYDVTPEGGIPSVHKCTVFDDGSFAVAGAEGWIGRYTP